MGIASKWKSPKFGLPKKLSASLDCINNVVMNILKLSKCTWIIFGCSGKNYPKIIQETFMIYPKAFLCVYTFLMNNIMRNIQELHLNNDCIYHWYFLISESFMHYWWLPLNNSWIYFGKVIGQILNSEKDNSLIFNGVITKS